MAIPHDLGLVVRPFNDASAVLYALSARHVKRIASHLANISTAVLQPVDWMDYTDEPAGTGAEQPPSTESETDA